MPDDETPAFLYDDFFISESDPGIVLPIRLGGRVVPFTLTRGLTLRDKEEAASAAMTRHFDAESGRLVIDGLNDAALTAELLVRGIKAWPFTYRDGRPVPITKDEVMRLPSEASEQLVQALTGALAAKEREADGPFVPGSTPPSAPVATATAGEQPAAPAAPPSA